MNNNPNNAAAAAAVPFPPVNLPDPEIHPAERGFHIVLENTGRIVNGYIRGAQQQHHEYAYERYEKVINLGQKGKILYGRAYQRLSSSSSSDNYRYRETQEFVVIKKLNKRYCRQLRSENPRNEIAIANLIGDNHHVVGMHEVLQDDKYLYMIMPYFGSDLLMALEQGGGDPNDVALLKTLCTNLHYCQQHNIIHRDLSPENIIVHAEQHEQVCPLIDFAMGLQCASLFGNAPQPICAQDAPCGKLPYMSPEIARCRDFSFGVDIWALGCTMFCVWTHQRLYDQPGDRSYNLFFRNNNGGGGGLLLENNNAEAFVMDDSLYMDDANLPPDYQLAVQRLELVQHQLTPLQRQLLVGMLQVDPAQRMTAQDVLNHEYLQ